MGAEGREWLQLYESHRHLSILPIRPISPIFFTAPLLAYLATVTQWALKGMGRVKVDTGSHP
jgi:hypothetical protein